MHFHPRLLHPWWRSVALAVAAVSLIAGVTYPFWKRPGDIANPDVAFEEGRSKSKGERSGTSWPIYGLDPQRTRYLNVRGLRPPFRQLWKFKAGSLLEFSPIYARGSLYLINNQGTIFALNARNGRTRWQRDLGRLNASSPAYAKGRIYAVNLRPGQAFALDAETGKIIWRRKLPGRAESSPIYDRGRIYFGCECRELFALNAKNGKIVWRRRLAGEIKAAPALDGGTLYVGDYGGKMWAVRARDGSVRWSTDSLGTDFGFKGNFYSTPAVAFGRVYAGNTDSRVYSFSARTGQIAWTHSTGDYVYAGPAVASTRHTTPTVYAGSYDGWFYALDARTGKRRWRHRAGGRISGAGTVVGETVYFANLAAKRTIGLDVRNGKRVFEYRSGGFNPVISDGQKIFLTGYSHVVALEPRRR